MCKQESLGKSAPFEPSHQTTPSTPIYDALEAREPIYRIAGMHPWAGWATVTVIDWRLGIDRADALVSLTDEAREKHHIPASLGNAFFVRRDDLVRV